MSIKSIGISLATLIAIALIAALGPGTATTSIPSAPQLFTRASPGSEMQGIPASVTMAQLSPSRSRLHISSPRSMELYL